MSKNWLKYVVLAGLFAVPFVPLVVSSSLFFPFITGKAFIFRVIVEIIFAAWLVLAIRDESYRPKFSWIFGSIIIFLFIMGVADFFAINSHKAFWSNFERMEGFITLLHLGAFFLVMGSVLKTQEIWNKLLTTSLGASSIMAIYSFLQIAGKININQGGVRVDGTLGNASYLGIYMVFHIFIASFLFVRFKANWQKILIGIVALMDIIVLYFTATRGAILGFLGGVFVTFVFLVFKSDPTSSAQKGLRGARKIAAIGLIAVVAFVGLFILVRNNSFIKNNPVLSRFASLSFSEVKTQGRYFVWPMAWKGFLENPVLGWGQEGFNFVFNKYYDPRMYNQEPWFDRAHNTYLDWLIAGGALGFLSYISIIFSLVYYALKAKDDFLKKEDKAIILGLISAYLFNNLFVFDQISSYILFFTVLAFVHTRAPEANLFLWNKISAKFKNILGSDRPRPVTESFILIILVLVLYFGNFIPWRHNRNLLEVLKFSNQGKVGAIEVYAKPLSNYGLGFSESLEHVSQAAMGIITNPNATNDFKQSLFNVVDKAFQKQLERTPNDTRYRLFYGLFLSRFGWYGKAIEQLEEARKFSPNKQSILFEMVNNFLLDGKTTKALEAAKTAYELEPSYEEARFIYGITLLASGNTSLSNEILKGMSESKIIFDDRYLTILLALKKFPEIVEVAKKRIELDPGNLQHRITLAAAYLQAGRRGEAVQTIEEIIKIEPSFKEKGEYYINEIKAGRNP